MLRFQVNNSAIGLSPALLAQEEALAMMHSASDGMLASGLALSTTLIAQNGMNRAEEMRLLEVMVSAFNAAILVMLYGSFSQFALFNCSRLTMGPLRTVLVFRTMAQQLRAENSRGHDFLALLPVSVIEHSKSLTKAITQGARRK